MLFYAKRGYTGFSKRWDKELYNIMLLIASVSEHERYVTWKKAT